MIQNVYKRVSPEYQDEIAITIERELWEEEGEGRLAYTSLSRNDLTNLSEVLLDLLTHVRVRAADRILIYDYNTSLSTLAMSRVFAPGLEEGVCEKMGSLAICTDGLSELAARTAFVFSRWQPQVLLIRSGLVAPFRSKMKTDNLKRSNPSLRTVIVSHNDVAPWPRNNQLGIGDFDRFLLYTQDPSLFMCIVKPCGGLYYPNRFYTVRCMSERERTSQKSVRRKLAISPSFSKTNRHAISSSLECASPQEVCYCGSKHQFRTEELIL